MSLLQALAQVVVEAMDGDPRRVVLGEDVLDGGMLGLTRAAAERDDLRARLISTPLTPAVLPGYATGLAMSGLRPLAVLPSAGALVDGLASLRESARIGWRSGDTLAPDTIFLAPYGPGFGLGGDGTEAVDALLASVPGVHVVCLGQAEEGPALLRAILDPDARAPTTVVLLPRTLLLRELEAGLAHAELDREPGEPSEVARGSTATVLTWGPTVELAQAAAAGRDVRVIDLGSLNPIDRDAVVSAADTGKVVIAHTGPRSHGVGAELAALVAEHAILHLDAPVLRVTGADAPLSPGDEMSALPTVEAISNAIDQVVNY